MKSCFLLALLLLAVPSQESTPAHSVRHLETLTYPNLALQGRIEGEVKLHIAIDADGNVVEAELEHGDPLLAPAAVANILKWKFSKGEKGEMEIDYKFVLLEPPVETRSETECIFDLPNSVTVVTERLKPIIDVGPMGGRR